MRKRTKTIGIIAVGIIGILMSIWTDREAKVNQLEEQIERQTQKVKEIKENITINKKDIIGSVRGALQYKEEHLSEIYRIRIEEIKDRCRKENGEYDKEKIKEILGKEIAYISDVEWSALAEIYVEADETIMAEIISCCIDEKVMDKQQIDMFGRRMASGASGNGEIVLSYYKGSAKMGMLYGRVNGMLNRDIELLEKLMEKEEEESYQFANLLDEQGLARMGITKEQINGKGNREIVDLYYEALKKKLFKAETLGHALLNNPISLVANPKIEIKYDGSYILNFKDPIYGLKKGSLYPFHEEIAVSNDTENPNDIVLKRQEELLDIWVGEEPQLLESILEYFIGGIFPLTSELLNDEIVSETKLFIWSTKCKYYSVYEGSTNITAQLPPREAMTLLEELNAIKVSDTKLKDYKKNSLKINENDTITVEDIVNKLEKNRNKDREKSLSSEVKKYEAKVIEEYFNLKTMKLKKELTMEDLRDSSKMAIVYNILSYFK